MRRKRLLWQLYPSYLLITLVALVAVALYATNALQHFYYERTAADLKARALLVVDDVRQELAAAGPDQIDTLRGAIDPLCKRLGRKADTRITVVLPRGEVVGDTEESPQAMESHRDRPEIRDALDGRVLHQVRFSHTLGQTMMYLAIPVQDNGRILGILRTSIPVTSIDRALRTVQLKIAASGLVVALLAAGVCWFVSRRISRPLEQLKHGAERFARGDLRGTLPTDQSQEIGTLAETMNQMAADLDDRIRALVAQRNEREAILSSMVEGVLAVDTDKRLLSLNQAAARLLTVDLELAQGRTLQEVVRNRDLQQLVDTVLASQGPVEDEVVLEETDKRFLQAHGTVLRDSTGEGIGVLVVLNDVTRLRRLENVRRDFVANASHELKTPVTSIKGFVETLLDGAMNDPDDARRFLEIVAGQADRLSAIVNDLLDLSRIEQQAEGAEVVLVPGPIKGVLEAAVGVCRVKAAEKNVRVELNCDDHVQAAFDAPLLEQAIVNLLDNAVKYSPDGQLVQIEAARTDGEVVIHVRDRGCGIGREHLPRIFERFYRVDKARSRKLGGTGLGLAIVKHIAQAHNGRTTVESRLGEGTTFSLYLPAA